jgi:uncharacterized membrane protein
MIYVLIYLIVGFIWGLPRWREQLKRYRVITHDQQRSKKQIRRDIMIITTVLWLQSMIFYPYLIYQQIKMKRGQKHE